ncbi:hypothetical protein BC792_10127 [Sphingobacterium allocomposti]|uniref:Uncharacterized protein n=1 Tax=Sphingobacterium allocomposti TaxID=415956 RepID=A0A5S5DQY7_9SPHI|nr:hypothetical protein BC792_10127 [Sphingobacterium composti Yoo et al. 2007 non Ten et al. 2007]
MYLRFFKGYNIKIILLLFLSWIAAYLLVRSTAINQQVLRGPKKFTNCLDWYSYCI